MRIVRRRKSVIIISYSFTFKKEKSYLKKYKLPFANVKRVVCMIQVHISRIICPCSSFHLESEKRRRILVLKIEEGISPS